MKGTSSTIYLVDDDSSVRRAVKRLLESAGYVTEAFASAQEFLDRCDFDAAGCVILDLAMPGLDGLHLQQLLAERRSVLPIVFLTGHGDIPTSVRAMRGGAVDFLTKPVSKSELFDAVERAIRQCEALRRERQELEDAERRLAALTPREREVLTHLLAGKLNKQIAADLGASEQTIKIHRARVMRKVQVRTLAALLQLAARAGIKSASSAQS